MAKRSQKSEITSIQNLSSEITSWREQHGASTEVTAQLLTTENAHVYRDDIMWWENPRHGKSAAAGLALNALVALSDDVVKTAIKAEAAIKAAAAVKPASKKASAKPKPSKASSAKAPPKSVQTKKLNAKQAEKLLTPAGFTRWVAGKPLSAVDYIGEVAPKSHAKPKPTETQKLHKLAEKQASKK